MNLLIVNDHKTSRDASCLMCEREGHETQPAGSCENALLLLKQADFDAVLLEVNLGQKNGFDVLDRIVKDFPNLPVVMFSGEGTIKLAVQAIQRGAADFMEGPFTIEQLKPLLARVDRLNRINRNAEKLRLEVKDLSAQNPELLLDFSAPEMCAVLEVVLRAARTPASILITGESGTGKSVLARAIHQQSHLADKPFVTLSCPSLCKELLESELFGHARGSFTGAVTDHWGKVRAAEGGTLFLDEIGDLPLEIQPKLLRLLQEREYERLGENVTRHANLRIIAATHRDLKKQMQEGAFRADLYYRLNVISVNMPPLRERRAELIRLANHFIEYFSRGSGSQTLKFSKTANDRLVEYSWPGNLRELRNAIERAVTMVTGREVTAKDLPGGLADSFSGEDEGMQPGSLISLKRLEALHIQRVLERSGSIVAAARILGIDQATIYRRRKNPASVPDNTECSGVLVS